MFTRLLQGVDDWATMKLGSSLVGGQDILGQDLLTEIGIVSSLVINESMVGPLSIPSEKGSYGVGSLFFWPPFSASKNAQENLNIVSLLSKCKGIPGGLRVMGGDCHYQLPEGQQLLCGNMRP